MFTRMKKNEDGQVLVFVALLMFILLGFAALVVDVGHSYAEKRQLQNAVDAAALAGAQELPNESAATTVAKKYAELNDVEQVNTIVTTPYNGDSTKIEVVGTKTVKHYFATVLGFAQSEISARAVAQRSSGGGLSHPAFNYVLFSGNRYPDPLSLSVELQNEFRITGSTNTVIGNIHGNFDLDTYQNEIIGIASAVGKADVSDITTAKPNASYIEIPDFSSVLPQIKADAIAAGQYYAGDFSSSKANSLNLTAPVYVEGEANLTNVSFSGKGTLYAGGQIKGTGKGGEFHSESSIALYSGYTSTSSAPAQAAINFSGSDKKFTGMVYAPNGTVYLTGSKYRFNGSVIGRVIRVTGSNYIFQGADFSESFPYDTGGPVIKLIE